MDVYSWSQIVWHGQQTNSLKYRITAHSGISCRHSSAVWSSPIWSTPSQVYSIDDLNPVMRRRRRRRRQRHDTDGPLPQPKAAAQTFCFLKQSNAATCCFHVSMSVWWPVGAPHPSSSSSTAIPHPQTQSKTGVEQQLIFQERLYLKLLQNGPTHQGWHTVLSGRDVTLLTLKATDFLFAAQIPFCCWSFATRRR